MTTEEVDVNNDESRHNCNFLTAFITAIKKQNFNQDTGFHSSLLVSPIWKENYVVDLFFKVKMFGKAKYDCNNYLYEIHV